MVCPPKAVLGPPDVSVSGCGNCLLLQLNTSNDWRLRKTVNFYQELIVVVRRSRDGAQVPPRASAHLLWPMASAVTFDMCSSHNWFSLMTPQQLVKEINQPFRCHQRL